MKFFSIFLFLGFSLFQFTAQAGSTGPCFCETGNWPPSEHAFFVMGCEMWMASQKNCSKKKIVEQNHDYLHNSDLSNHNENELVRIGYVGHWANSAETVSYLNQVVRPILAQGRSVTVENTACFAMNQPELILEYVKGLSLQPQQNLDIQGNQTESVGEWTFVLGKSKNFSAEVSSANSSVIYPACGYYQGKSCLGKFQGGQSGICRDVKSQEQSLTCCKSSEVRNEDGSMAEFYTWEPAQKCL